MKMRLAIPDEFDEIFRLGKDVWGTNIDETDYIRDCHTSIKYQSGEWYVLENENKIVAATILYRLKYDIYGIGSLATRIDLRNKGFGSLLLKQLTFLLKSKMRAKAIYIWSDIDPLFYEKIGFTKLPKKFQLVPSSSCMVLTDDLLFLESLSTIEVPKYF